jgi:hypothetical protein
MHLLVFHSPEENAWSKMQNARNVFWCLDGNKALRIVPVAFIGTLGSSFGRNISQCSLPLTEPQGTVNRSVAGRFRFLQVLKLGFPAFRILGIKFCPLETSFLCAQVSQYK